MRVFNAIIVGGPIAVGKSTLVGSLPFKSIQELDSNDKLQNLLLERMYAGNKDAATTFQLDILCSRFKKYKLLSKKEGIIVFDRSILEDFIFAKTILKDSKNDFEYYLSVWEDKVEEMIEIGKPLLYIILTFDWNTFKERIFARNRDSEIKNFQRNINYFKDLLKNYLNEIKNLCLKYKIDYIVIDTSQLNRVEVLNKVKDEFAKRGITNGS